MTWSRVSSVRPARLPGLLVVAALSLPQGAAALPEVKVVASVSPSFANATFAEAIDLDGDTFICGESGADGISANEGGAYVFVRSGTNWVFQQRIKASDSGVGHGFGGGVALDGDYALVGSFLRPTRPGFSYGSLRNRGLHVPQQTCWPGVRESKFLSAGPVFNIM